MLQQPKVWIRVRKQFVEEVKRELNELTILFEENNKQLLAWSVPQRTKLDSLKTFSTGYFEIQDLNSQRTGNYFQPNPKEHWFDCCAASGGKSLLLQSIESKIKLTVSDNRIASLENLDERFKRARISNYQSFVADIAREIPASLINQQFDGIIVDAPCTGSGTWARTPEQLSFFRPEQINYYKNLQQAILKNVAPLVKQGKPLVYITCSVFKQENEEQIQFASSLGFKVEEQQLLEGHQNGSATMFAVRLIAEK